MVRAWLASGKGEREEPVAVARLTFDQTFAYFASFDALATAMTKRVHTSSYPSLSAPAQVSSPASLLPFGRNQYWSTEWKHTTTRALARWKMATPAPMVVCALSQWPLVGVEHLRLVSRSLGCGEDIGCAGRLILGGVSLERRKIAFIWDEGYADQTAGLEGDFHPENEVGSILDVIDCFAEYVEITLGLVAVRTLHVVAWQTWFSPVSHRNRLLPVSRHW